MFIIMIVLLILNYGKYFCKVVYGRNMYINIVRGGIFFVVEIISFVLIFVICFFKIISVF